MFLKGVWELSWDWNIVIWVWGVREGRVPPLWLWVEDFFASATFLGRERIRAERPIPRPVFIARPLRASKRPPRTLNIIIDDGNQWVLTLPSSSPSSSSSSSPSPDQACCLHCNPKAAPSRQLRWNKKPSDSRHYWPWTEHLVMSWVWPALFIYCTHVSVHHPSENHLRRYGGAAKTRGAAVPSQQVGGGDGEELLQPQAVRIAKFTFQCHASMLDC